MTHSLADLLVSDHLPPELRDGRSRRNQPHRRVYLPAGTPIT